MGALVTTGISVSAARRSDQENGNVKSPTVHYANDLRTRIAHVEWVGK